MGLLLLSGIIGRPFHWFGQGGISDLGKLINFLSISTMDGQKRAAKEPQRAPEAERRYRLPGIVEEIDRRGLNQEDLSRERKYKNNWLNRIVNWRRRPELEDFLWLCARLEQSPCQALGHPCRGIPYMMEEVTKRELKEKTPKKPRRPKKAK